jgi:hypothetical protein
VNLVHAPAYQLDEQKADCEKDYEMANFLMPNFIHAVPDFIAFTQQWGMHV